MAEDLEQNVREDAQGDPGSVEQHSLSALPAHVDRDSSSTTPS
jgi:hypothetical protein